MIARNSTRQERWGQYSVGEVISIGVLARCPSRFRSSAYRAHEIRQQYTWVGHLYSVHIARMILMDIPCPGTFPRAFPAILDLGAPSRVAALLLMQGLFRKSVVMLQISDRELEMARIVVAMAWRSCLYPPYLVGQATLHCCALLPTHQI